MAGTQKDVYLVIGGSGFLGRHICGTTCIIHTASPPHGLKDPSLYWKVNVDGTKAVIAAAQEIAGVVFSGSDVIDCDERVPMPEKPFDVYNDSKAHGEAAVLAANGKEGLLTIALRPAGIFGYVYQKGQTHFQIGDNNNLFDLTYVENAAYAHLLAADKLAQPPPAPPLCQVPEKDDYDMKNLPPLTDAEQEIIGYPLPPIQLTIKPRRVPTSAARPLGPYLTPPHNAEKLEAAFRASESQDGATSRPIVRTRFDAMSEYGVARSKLFNPDHNGEPIYFWDLARYIWYQLDTIFPGQRKEKKPFVLPTSIGMVAAQLLEVIGWITGRPAALTKFRVTFSVVNRWQNIEKAWRVLGYEPQVSAEDGIKRMVQWFANEVASGSYKAAH
ncbi:NAD(P)-binding protein [Hymenopellis radicata]|nr:NAD(P)-binding protein [Hymenopellis radicata]